jgi:uncharacterized protein YoaH (UPF0181 family)
MRVLLALVILLARVSHAQQIGFDWKGDGNSLLQSCDLYVQAADGKPISSGDAVQGSFCTGYLTGILDFDITLSHLENDKSGSKGVIRHICVPDGVSTGQAVRIVVKWLRNNPERLHYPASVLALAGLRDAFPCSK